MPRPSRDPSRVRRRLGSNARSSPHSRMPHRTVVCATASWASRPPRAWRPNPSSFAPMAISSLSCESLFAIVSLYGCKGSSDDLSNTVEFELNELKILVFVIGSPKDISLTPARSIQIDPNSTFVKYNNLRPWTISRR